MNPDESLYYWRYKKFRDGSIEKVALWMPENKALYRLQSIKALNRKIKILRLFRDL